MEQSTSFTPLGSIQPPGPCLLLPGSCNPAMDLVALFTTPTHLPPAGKGKQKAGDERRISLWRVSGTKVWDVGYEGSVRGLAWSTDGLYLSVLLRDQMRGETVLKIRHISVHDGSAVHDTILEGSEYSSDGGLVNGEEAFWQLEWSLSDMEWPVPEKGSSRMIIGLLPGVTPVEEPKPTNPMLLKLMQQQNKDKPKGPIRHKALSLFPQLLPTYKDTKPQILSVIPPRSSVERRLLSGIYPMPDVPPDQNLILAGIAHMMSGYLDAILRGLENAELAYKEGDKQTMIWREELETCGEQQGLSIKDTHSDLFRFLLTGRCNLAITEWLGNRLTGRVLSKWETSVDESYRDIHKLLVESAQPALERVILLIDEVQGLARTPGWTVHPTYFTQGLEKAKGLAFLLERVRRLAKSQRQAAEEWFRWIHFEITRTTASDQSTDNLPSATHDVKLVWSFMKRGFTDSPMFSHFPSDPDAMSLPIEAWKTVPSKPVDLDKTLRDTLSKLNQGAHPLTPTFAAAARSSPGIDDSIDSSHVLSSMQESPDTSRRSSGSSQGTVEKRHPGGSDEPKRCPEAEPLVWAKELVSDCATLFKTDKKPPASTTARIAGRMTEPVWAMRQVEESMWVAFVQPRNNVICIGAATDGEDDGMRFAAFSLPEGCTGEALSFYDNQDITVVLSTNAGRQIAMVPYRELELEDIPIAAEWTATSLLDGLNPTQMQVLPTTRSRAIAPIGVETGCTLAVNGREGRRIACVADGAGFSVFDMDEDEDDDGDEGGDGEGEDGEDGEDEDMEE